MLIFSTWTILLIYSISWIVGLTVPSNKKPHWLDLQGMRLAWLLHTLVLFFTLFSLSNWPFTFIEDFMSGLAWACLIISQAFPGRWSSVTHPSILRVFSILLLGLSIFLKHSQSPGIFLIHSTSWLNQSILALHIVTFLAGYVLFGASCVASILFLYQEHQLKAKLARLLSNGFPALATLDHINIRATKWGFIFLTMGIMMGMMLNEGPRVGWSGIRLGLSMGIWCIYAVILLLRELNPSPNRRFIIWPILGFMCFLVALVMEWFKLFH